MKSDCSVISWWVIVVVLEDRIIISISVYRWRMNNLRSHKQSSRVCNIRCNYFILVKVEVSFISIPFIEFQGLIVEFKGSGVIPWETNSVSGYRTSELVDIVIEPIDILAASSIESEGRRNIWCKRALHKLDVIENFRECPRISQPWSYHNRLIWLIGNCAFKHLRFVKENLGNVHFLELKTCNYKYLIKV